MALTGNLKTMPFADILQFLSSNSSTGTLQVRREQVVKMIFFEKGKIIFSSSSDPKEFLGHFLVSHDLISEDDLRNAMEVQRSTKMLLGKVLVIGGKVSEEQMMKMLQLKAEETVYSLFLWDEGEFTFFDDEFINRLFVRISLNPQKMIFEGVLRRDEWLRIRQVFPTNAVVLEPVAGRVPDPGQLDPLPQKAYELVDGDRSIEDIALLLHAVDYVACKALFGLYEQDYLRIHRMQPIRAPKSPPHLSDEHSMEQLLEIGLGHIADNRFENALDILKKIPQSFPNYNAVVAPMIDRAERETVRAIFRVLPPEKLLRLKVPLSQISFSGLTPEEGFLLSRIDGTWDVRSILSVTPMKELDILRLLKKFLDRGFIAVS